MVFTTLVLKKYVNFVATLRPGFSRRWAALFLLLLPLLVWASNFAVLEARTRLENGVYLLTAKIDYDLSPAALEALRNGIPLTVSLEMEVWRRREWLWDELIASLQQRFHLEYHALARQYVVINLNNGEQKSFPTRLAATDYLGRIDNFPLLDASLLGPADGCYGRLRATLDIEALPAPLRPLAYLSNEWHLTSEWYAWPF